MKRKRSDRPKRVLTEQQRALLRERLAKGRAKLAEKRAARATEQEAAGSAGSAPALGDAGSRAGRESHVEAEAPPLPASNAEPGISPREAAPPPPMPAREPGEQAAKAQSILGGETADPAAPGAPLPVAPPRIDPKACVALVELANDVTIRAMAGSKGIAITPEVEKLTKLDPDTKKNLESFAPFAVPYLEQLLARGPVVGALIFGGVAVVAIAANLGQLKKHAPKEPKKPKAPTPPAVEVPTMNGAATHGMSTLQMLYGTDYQPRR